MFQREKFKRLFEIYYWTSIYLFFFHIFIKKVINGGHRDLDSVLISEFDFSTFAANAWKKVSFRTLYKKVFISILFKINNTRKYFKTKLIFIFCSRRDDFYFNMAHVTWGRKRVLIWGMVHFWTSKKRMLTTEVAHFWTSVVGCTTSFDWPLDKKNAKWTILKTDKNNSFSSNSISDRLFP